MPRVHTAARSHHLPQDAFEGARRAVFCQARTFAPPAGFALPALVPATSEVTAGPTEHATSVVDCYDTADLTLARAGVLVWFAVDDDTWTVLLPELSSAGEPVRRDVEYVGPAGEPPEGLRLLLRRYLHGRPVTCLGRCSIDRTTTPLLDRSGLREADVVDERAVVARSDGQVRRYRVIDAQVRDLDGVGHRLLGEIETLMANNGCTTQPRVTAVADALSPKGGWQ